MSKEIIGDVVRASPAVAYSGVHFAGVSIADWVSLATLVYILAMLVITVPKVVTQLKAWRAAWVLKRASRQRE